MTCLCFYAYVCAFEYAYVVLSYLRIRITSIIPKILLCIHVLVLQFVDTCTYAYTY